MSHRYCNSATLTVIGAEVYEFRTVNSVRDRSSSTTKDRYGSRDLGSDPFFPLGMMPINIMGPNNCLTEGGRVIQVRIIGHMDFWQADEFLFGFTPSVNNYKGTQLFLPKFSKTCPALNHEWNCSLSVKSLITSLFSLLETVNVFS